MKIWANAHAIAETGGLDAHMARLLSRLAEQRGPAPHARRAPGLPRDEPGAHLS